MKVCETPVDRNAKYQLTSNISSPSSSADKNEELGIPALKVPAAFNSERKEGRNQLKMYNLLKVVPEKILYGYQASHV